MAENQTSMAQYFEQTNQRLERIERATLGQKTVLTFNEACSYIGISQRKMKKLILLRKISFHSPYDKLWYFKRLELEEWCVKSDCKIAQKRIKRAFLYILQKVVQFCLHNIYLSFLDYFNQFL